MRAEHSHELGDVVTESYCDLRNLKTWQAGIELVEQVYGLTRAFPKHEQYGLAGQMQRAAVSVPSNIAEGRARDSRQEYIRGLMIARGSLAELETQLVISARLKYIPTDAPVFEQVKRCHRLLHGLITSLKKDQ